jgi:hypothetical protein
MNICRETFGVNKSQRNSFVVLFRKSGDLNYWIATADHPISGDLHLQDARCENAIEYHPVVVWSQELSPSGSIGEKDS